MDLVDTSTLSLCIGGIVTIITILITKYMLEEKNKEFSSEEQFNNIWLYSLASGLGMGVITLIIYKQVILHQSNNIMTDSFYS